MKKPRRVGRGLVAAALSPGKAAGSAGWLVEAGTHAVIPACFESSKKTNSLGAPNHRHYSVGENFNHYTEKNGVLANKWFTAKPCLPSWLCYRSSSQAYRQEIWDAPCAYRARLYNIEFATIWHDSCSDRRSGCSVRDQGVN